MADAPAPKMKKLPFKPTALRKRAAPAPTPSDEARKDDTEDDDGLSMFRRAKEMAPILAADRERSIKKKQRHKEEGLRRRSSNADNQHAQAEDQDSKAAAVRQIMEGTGSSPQPVESGDSKAEMEGEGELATPPPSKRTRTTPSSARPESSHANTPSRRRTSPRSNQYTPSKRTRSKVIPASTPIISLDSDPEDEDGGLPLPASSRSRSNSVEVAELPQPPVTSSQRTESQADEEEDEFAEYIRKAEQDRKEQEARDMDSSKAAGVSILITSPIEGAKPCFFKLRTDQPFAKIRTAWIAFQAKRGQIPPVDISALILTWRRNRVYVYSTLHSLGIRPYGDRLVTDGSSRKGLNSDGTQVLMEMWTPEAFQQWEEEEERRRKVEAGELSEEEYYDAPEPPEVKLKVILRARDLEEVRLTVRPGTTVETLVTGFKTQRELDPEKDVSLWFDGDRMEEHVTIEEAEIDDMDTIEVHVK